MLWMQGLITKERKELDPSAAPFAKDLREIEGLMQGDGLVEDYFHSISHDLKRQTLFLSIAQCQYNNI
jgi:hypothetical protein